jgi:hypothetical protein
MMNGVGAHRALTVHVATDVVIDRGVTVAEAAAAGRAREIGSGVSRAGRPAAEVASTSGKVRCTAVNTAEMPAASREVRRAAVEAANSPAGKMSPPEMSAAYARSTEMRSATTEMRSATTEVSTTASAEVSTTASAVETSAAMATTPASRRRVDDSGQCDR